jgi:hypothetical protein
MAKYYVSSGDLRVTCNADDQKEAALFAFSKIKDKKVEQLGKVTVVSEVGFDSDCDDDMYFVTSDLLDETNQTDDFQATEWLT